MFTGIITATAPILSAKKQNNGLKLTLPIPDDWEDIEIGESIATNGACLTVSEKTETEYSVFLMPETLKITSFSHKLPKRLNLERALKIGDRLSGHIVQGHVDGVGEVSKIDETDGYRIFIKFPTNFRPLLIQKGSITIDGVSLTVASLTNNTFSVALIPHTLNHTTLGLLRLGDKVNLEFDIIGKYATNLIKDKPYAKS